jgi:hypothetical protein
MLRFRLRIEGPFQEWSCRGLAGTAQDQALGKIIFDDGFIPFISDCYSPPCLELSAFRQSPGTMYREMPETIFAENHGIGED